MAAVNYNPSGFSYAQAARGHSSAGTSQTPSSKVTSGTTSPSTGILSEVTTPRSNWADDVEASVGVKAGEFRRPRQDEQRNSQAKEGPVDKAKMEDKTLNGVSGVSSPDLTASSSTTTKDEYELLSPPNGSSSESAWEIISQASEPSWIGDRKERQSTSQTREKASKDEKKGKDSATKTVPKPVILQEARPPTINPWLKRAEEAKAKASTLPPRPPVAAPVSDTSTLKENQRPRADSRWKANSVASIPQESLANAADEIRKQSASQVKRTNDVRNKSSRQNSEQDTVSSRFETPLSTLNRAAPTERQSLPNLLSAQSLVSDESSWPTPDTAQEKERKDVTDKEAEEKREDEATPTTKRKKQEWKVLPVTPSIKFETQIMNDPKGKPRGTPNGERGGRGGNGSRGRGGYRGTQNGANVGDRQASRTGTSPTSRDADSSTDPRGLPSTAGNESIPSKPKRASSASSWRERKSDLVDGRSFSGQNTTGMTPFDKSASDAINGGSGTTSSLPKPPPRAPENFRTESPKKMDVVESEVKDDGFVPTPIPRRSSNGSQTQGAVEGGEITSRDAAPPRAPPADGRKDSRGFESSRDTTGTGPRGGRRGGRGRGGNGARELANGHPSSHTYPGPYAAEFVAASYGIPPSPSAYQVPRGHHQFNYPLPGRGGWNNRGNPRSQSIPIDTNYYQRSGQYPAGAPPQLAPINTYAPGMFDPNGVPMTAMPYPNQMDPQYVIQMVATQLDYYFSVDNLLKDMFLRKHMDSQGFVFMDIVANFNRVRQLTQEKDIIRTACMNSDVIEIRIGDDGKERLRKADGWEQFLLPIEQREESAQNNGPEHLQRPERPQLHVANLPPQFGGPASASVPSMQQGQSDRRSYDSVYPMNGVPAQYGAFGGIPEVMSSEMNGEEMRGRAAKSPIHETPVSPMGQPIDAAFEEADFEPDAFPDEQAAMLTVVVKMSQQQRLPYHNLSSRTFSNGSIDTRTIMSEVDRPAETASQPKKDGPPTVNGSDSKLPPVPIPRRPSPNKPRSSERVPSNSDLDVFWVKDQEVPVASLPSDLTSEPYVQLRIKGLDQRNHAATGTCPYDMDVLYQFWCHFLIRNFNNRMYSEFMSLANEDARQRHNLTGMQNLIKFYDQSLRSQNTIRDRVVKDYVKLVRSEPPELQGTSFKTLRAAWRNGALPLKNRKKVLAIVDKKFEEQLERLDA